MKKVLGVIIKKIYKFLMIIIYRPKIIGRENIPNDTAAIICPNHVHALDAPALLAVTNRKIRFMAKEELWKSVGFRFMAFVFYVFPVKRGKNDTDAIKTSIKILKSNEILGIYPEGTRHGMDKGIKPKNGAVTLALRNNVPIIPFAVIGDFKPFTKVTYKFGKPMDLSEYKDKAKDKETLDMLTNKVMQEVLKLRDGKEETTV